MTKLGLCRSFLLVFCLGCNAAAFAQDEDKNKDEGKAQAKEEKPTKAKEEKPTKAKEKADDTEKKDDNLENKELDQLKKITIEVPERLQGQAYELHIGDEIYQLDKGKIEITPTLDPVSIELFDSSGRLVSDISEYVDKNLMDAIRLRSFEVGIGIGTVHGGNKKNWRKIFLRGDRFQVMGHFAYYKRSFGLRAEAGFQTESQAYEESFRSSYFGTFIALNMMYELVPFRKFQNYMGKIKLTPLLGAMYTSYSVTIEDDYTKEKGSGSNPGANLGFFLKFPLASNFNIFWRYMLQVQKMEISALDFESGYSDIHHNLTIGGGYAF